MHQYDEKVRVLGKTLMLGWSPRGHYGIVYAGVGYTEEVTPVMVDGVKDHYRREDMEAAKRKLLKRVREVIRRDAK